MNDQLVSLLLKMSHRKFLGYKIILMFLISFFYTAAAVAVHIGFEVDTIPVLYEGKEAIVNLDESVKDVAYQLSKVFEIATDQQRLVLSDSGEVIPLTKKALKEYVSLKNKSVLQLQKIDAKVYEVVVKNRSNQSFDFLIDRLTTVKELQREIQKRFRIPLGAQEIVVQGTHEAIDKDISLQKQIAQNSVLYVEG